MSKNNYMGKIDRDYSGTSIPSYDSPKKCKNCKSAIGQDYNNWEKFCDVCQKDFCSKCVDDHICGEKEQEEAEYNAIYEGEDDGTFSDHLEEIKN